MLRVGEQIVETIEAHTADAAAIRRAAGQCLKRVDLTRRLRLLGVRAGALAKPSDLAAARGHAARAGPLIARDARAGESLPLFGVDASIQPPSTG